MSEETQTLTVGYEAVDAEHELQVKLITALQQAIEKGQETSEIEALFDQLNSYTSAHYMSEQLLMRLYAYPGYQAHVEDHDRIMERINALHQQYAAGEMEATLELGDTIKNLLVDHIKHGDLPMGQYLAQHQ